MDPSATISNTSRWPSLVGLSMLGWGLSMVLGIMPHEDPIVGAGLALFGGALLFVGRGLPQIRAVPWWLSAAGGLGLVSLVLGFRIAFPSPWDVPKTCLLILGVGLIACAPFLDRPIRWAPRGRPPVYVRQLVACVLAILGAPLSVWAIQAAFKGLVGSSPIEAFTQTALLPPVAGILWLAGIPVSVSGPNVTFGTPRGALSVDVGAACAGVQAMALFGAVLALYMLVERPGGKRLAFWSLVGILGVYVANVARLTTLLFVGYFWGSEALVRAHAQAGWIFFVAWAILFAWLARRPTGRRGRAALACPAPR